MSIGENQIDIGSVRNVISDVLRTYPVVTKTQQEMLVWALKELNKYQGEILHDCPE